MFKQKKKSPNSKNLNHVKSEDNILSFDFLRREINQLKKQLKVIKDSKKQQSKIIRHDNGKYQNASSQKPKQEQYRQILQNNYQTQIARNMNKENQKEIEVIIDSKSEEKTIKEVQSIFNKSGLNTNQLINIQYESRQHKLKMDIEINKLRRMLINSKTPQIYKHINEIFSLVNLFNKNASEVQYNLQKQVHNLKQNAQKQQKQSQEKYKQLIKNNKKLEKQVVDLKNHLINTFDDEESSMKILLQKSKSEQIEILAKEINLMMQEKKKLQSYLYEYDIKCKSLQEKCSTYEKSLEKKQQQIIQFEDDVNYLRLEAEKYKTQKRQIEKLYEKLSNQNKQLKKIYQNQIDQLQHQKNKWQNECNLRRNESEEIQSIEAQKNMLFRQLQELRSCYTNKCSEFSELKTTMHDIQKKLINSQAELFRLQSQNQKIQRNNDFCKYQIDKLNEEMQELRKMKLQSQSQTKNELRKLKTIQIEDKKQKQEKLKALDDIHNLIRKHKEQIEELQ